MAAPECARQVRAFTGPGDTVIGFSTSWKRVLVPLDAAEPVVQTDLLERS